jgi:3,4-dihydroxy 2-butanone 4-phosphate synthase/GTP cyclohydrolase II
VVLASSPAIRHAASRGRSTLEPREWFAGVGGPVPLRIHSECVLGDVFGSDLCDCGAHLSGAIELIAGREHGLVVYLRQEGRGIGLAGKLETLRLAPELDTFDRNTAAGYPADARTYGMVKELLVDLGITEVELISESPLKTAALERARIGVVRRLAVRRRLTPESAMELLAKWRRGYDIAYREDELLSIIGVGAPYAASSA